MATYASDGSPADFVAKHALASDGDKITFPAGAFIWPSVVAITKQIDIEGAGGGRAEGSSSTSVLIGTGTKTFTILAGSIVTSGFTVGETIRATYKANGTKYMDGTVTSWDGTVLVLNATSTGGSGTFTQWVFVAPALTTITNTNASGNAELLNITPGTTRSTTLSGVRLVQNNGVSAHLIIVEPVTGGKPVLIHDVRYTVTYGGLVTFKSNGHLLWNIFGDLGFNFAAGQALGTIRVKSFSPDDKGWNEVNSMGADDTSGTKNTYVESSYFSGISCTDWDDNARGVFRHCVIDHASCSSHGPDTSYHGAQHVEYYNNLGIFESLGDDTLNQQTFFESRGGTGIFADNVIAAINSGKWGDKPEFKLQVQMLDRNAGPFGLWGQGVAGAQYPCPRQIGMGHANTGLLDHDVTYAAGSVNLVTGLDSNGIYLGDLCPWYQWGNSGGASFTAPSIEASGYNQGTPDSVGDYFQVGRDWINGAKSGYLKYEYPHPLRAPAAPAFTLDPTSRTVTAGASTTFTATATGNPTPTYQWRKNGNNISGATSASYTIVTVTGDSGSYTCRATNTEGNATSAAGVLTVNTAGENAGRPFAPTNLIYAPA